jgi:hypothetical protein
LLRDVATGGYRFLPGIPAFSSGVVAMPGWEIVHATLAAPLPWREGFARIERHLKSVDRPRQALCGIMLRCPTPFSFDGFDEFNRGYRTVLDEWKILIEGENPIPRTNVAPVVGPPGEPVLYAFDYTISEATPSPTFVVAGAGEMRERGRGASGIVRHGETSPAAMREKARFVLDIMQARMRALGGTWPRITVIDVYAALPIHGIVEEEILAAAGPAAVHGVHWYPSRPPIQGLEFEMDMRSVAREIVL